MATDIAIFNNPAFGTIRTIEESGRVLFRGRGVATALGYENPGEAVRDHARSKGGRFVTPSIRRHGLYRQQFAALDGETWYLINHDVYIAAQIPRSSVRSCHR